MKRLLAALLVATFSTPLAAQPAVSAPDSIVTALARLESATAPSFAPDGNRIAYLSNAGGSPQAWIYDRRNKLSLPLTHLPDPVGAVAWSPAGDWIAYTVLPGGGLNTQVWVVRPDGRDARRLTPGGKEGTQLTRWTRDGKALLVSTNKDHPAANDAAMIDVASGAWTMLTANQGLDDASDLVGDRAIIGRLVGRGDDNIFALDTRSGETVLLTAHEGKATNGWGQLSPDGRKLYLASNVGRDKAAFATIAWDAAGRPGELTYLAAREDAVAEHAELSDDGRVAALVWNSGGRNELSLLDTASGALRAVALPFDLTGGSSFSADGRTLALTGGGADRTSDLYLVDVASGAVERITRSRHEGVDFNRLVRPELIRYAADDGTPLSGWLYRPRGATGPLPLVFNYHGGPEGQSRPTLFADAQALVASGIAVFSPNVRGSSGYGKAFMAMDDGAKRVNSIADIKASTDALVAQGVADPARLGIMGGSYGGYMVMAGVTEFPRMFAAGANLFGVVNFESFFRETEPWMAAISTTEYGDPRTEAAMLARLSPIHKLDRITTPLFVLHGANDTNVPVVEAEQIVASLRGRGVPVKYTLFPDEGHGWRKTANRVRSTREIVAFFVEHLKPGG